MRENNSSSHNLIFDMGLDKRRLEGYITGFFDADGHVGLYVYNGIPRPVISFSNDSIHVLNFIHYGFQLLGIDFRIYPKSRQLRINAWKEEESLREVVKFLMQRSQVKRGQLGVMLEAIDKYYSLPGGRRKKYNPQDKKEFKELAGRMRKMKFYWRPKKR